MGEGAAGGDLLEQGDGVLGELEQPAEGLGALGVERM